MKLPWTAWALLALAIITGGWMLFDGLRALTAGDYTTPSSGPFAGQLGPWAYIVSAVVLDPRSTFMKLAFALIGLLWLVSGVANVLGVGWARGALIASAVLSLWFLPFGTATGLIALTIIFFAH